MISLMDENQVKELCIDACDEKHPVGSLLGAAIVLIATLVCRINKESGDDINYIVDFASRQIKAAVEEIRGKKEVH